MNTLTIDEYIEIKETVQNIKSSIKLINDEVNKFPIDYIENHFMKLYILGWNILDYSDDTKNHASKTYDAILFKRPFPFFSYRCYIKWGTFYRSTWFPVDDHRLYNRNTNLSKLDYASVIKLDIILTNVLNNLLKVNKCK